MARIFGRRCCKFSDDDGANFFYQTLARIFNERWNKLSADIGAIFWPTMLKYRWRVRTHRQLLRGWIFLCALNVFAHHALHENYEFFARHENFSLHENVCMPLKFLRAMNIFALHENFACAKFQGTQVFMNGPQGACSAQVSRT